LLQHGQNPQKFYVFASRMGLVCTTLLDHQQQLRRGLWLASHPQHRPIFCHPTRRQVRRTGRKSNCLGCADLRCHVAFLRRANGLLLEAPAYEAGVNRC
jgi:hypothetical protein